LGKRVPQVNKYDTQVDKYDFSPPIVAEEPAEDKGKQLKYLTDYNSNSTNLKPTKETHSTDEELNKETSLDASIIRNSPIGTRPKLSPTILTTISTTLTQPTITVQTMTTTPPAATTTITSGTISTGTTVTPSQQITTAINKAL